MPSSASPRLAPRRSPVSSRRSPARVLLSALSALALVPSLGAQSTPPPPPASTEDEVVELESLEVTAFQRDYVAPATNTGLGLDADPAIVPLSLTSIPVDLLNDQQVNNVEDALRNVAGVTKFKQGNGGEERFAIRGFDASGSIYKDGARLNTQSNATLIATTETSNIERYDVLKGPAAILYGTGEPGGVINYITKKPRFERYASAEAIVGSYDYYRAEVDTTGPLSERFAYRLVGSYEDSDSYRDELFRQRLLVAPSLTFRPSERTAVTVQIERVEDNYTQERSQALDGDAVSGYSYGRVRRDQFFGVPGFNDQTESLYYRVAVLASHRVSENYQLELVAGATTVDKKLYDALPRASFADAEGNNTRVIAANGDVRIRGSLTEGSAHSEDFTLNNVVTLEDVSLLGLETDHKILLAYDFTNVAYTNSYFDTAGTVTYNVVSGERSGSLSAPVFSDEDRTQNYEHGFIAQDLISIGEKWHALVGARYTQAVSKYRYAPDTSREPEYGFSPRVGLVYRPVSAHSLYASYSEGFQPSTATDQAGAFLDPETTTQVELGFRSQFFEQRFIVSGAIFDTRKSDIGVIDPAAIAAFPDDDSAWWSANLGEIRTRGFELQAIGKVTASLRLIAGYAYLDNELSKADPAFADLQGNRSAGIPVHSANAWAVYDFGAGQTRGLSVGLGVFFQDDVFASQENITVYDGAITLDALASYRWEKWKVQLNVKNLTDELLVQAQTSMSTDDFAAIRVNTNAPRTFALSVAREF
jgi:iron complex outermembrane recepter protein